MISTEQYQKDHDAFLYHKFATDDSTPFKKGGGIEKKWVPKSPLFEKDIFDPFNIIPTEEELEQERKISKEVRNAKSLREKIED